jgi:predicted small lipoprotein YifL
VYNGSSVYATSNCQAASIVIAAAPTQLSLASATNPSPALTPINFTAQLSINGQAAGAGNTIVLSGVQTTPVTLTTGSNGSVSYTAAGFVPGQYPISASFAATANQLPSSASLSETVNANPTITTLSATPSPGLQHSPVVLAATVTATVGAAAPVGTVSFFDGATLLAAMPVATSGGISSTASYTTSALSPGSHTLSAVYTPTAASFLASQSAPLALTILPQDFTLSANPPSITIETQHHASMSLSLVSTGGFTAPITLTCGTLPAYVTCELPPTPVLLGSDQTVTVSLNLDTDAILNFSQATPPSRSRLAEGVVLAALCPLLLIGRRRRGLLHRIAMLVVIAALAGTLTACSSKYPGHTPPGVYVIPITATGTAVGNSSPTTHELDITLTVTQ